jgi:hypothetical protein
MGGTVVAEFYGVKRKPLVKAQKGQKGGSTTKQGIGEIILGITETTAPYVDQRMCEESGGTWNWEKRVCERPIQRRNGDTSENE